MTKFSQLAALFLSVLVLTACEQPAQQSEAPPPPPAAEVQSPADTVTSIDAEGNVAPFGMASRQPVPVPEAESAVAAAEVPAGEADTAAAAGLYNIHCVACHGADAGGVQGLGLSLVDSQLVASATQEELIAFLQAGRAGDAPDSVTKVPMPAFAWMTDAQLDEVTAYLKSLQ